MDQKVIKKKEEECNRAFSRINGTVVRVRRSEEERSEIMRNKHKLKGDIF